METRRAQFKTDPGGNAIARSRSANLTRVGTSRKKIDCVPRGSAGILRIGVECYPCFEWLTGIIGAFMQSLPDIDVDIIQKFQFTGLEGLQNYHIDVLITPDLIKKENITYETLTEYQLVLVVSIDHPLAGIEKLTPEQLSNEVLLTFPVPQERLDILTYFLAPAHSVPKMLKPIESLEIMLQMTALGRGVCVLPEWLADIKMRSHRLKKITIGNSGLNQKLYLALRESDQTIPYIRKFIEIGRQSAHHR